MGMGKYPNLLLLLPVVMLDQFLALRLSRAPGQVTWLYFCHAFCLQRSHPGHESNPRYGPEPAEVSFLSLIKYVVLRFRQGYEDPHWQYPAASYRDDCYRDTYSYRDTYQSHQWQPVAWQDDRGTGLSFGSGYGGDLLAGEEAMLSPGWVVLPGLAQLQDILLSILLGHWWCSPHAALPSVCIWEM